MQANGLTEEIFTQNLDPLCQALSDYFKDKSPAQFREELSRARREGKRYHLVVKQKINFLELKEIKKFPMFSLGPNKGGFMPIEIGRRIRPYGEIASRTIGFVNSSGVKLGVEGGFDNILRGTDGLTIKQKVSGNFWIPISSPLNIEPTNGMDVVTTIDIEMQDMVQTELRQRLLDTEADWGTVIVMETKTGHIKAIANGTRKDTSTVVEDYNYAIGMSQEPGSTFKLTGLITLLEDAKMSLSDPVNTEGGAIWIGPAKVVDTRKGGYGTITLKEVFEKSSNIGMAKSVNKYYASNPSRYVEALKRLGIDKPLNLQIAGEARPTLRHPSQKRFWDGMTLTMMSYGYAVRITPMQTLTLYNAIANGGKMIKPLFVKNLLLYGQVVESYQAEELIPQICSPETVEKVRSALEGVVETGTAKMLKNPMYSVAAKTGTAQIAVGRSGYYVNGGRHYLGSVAGYFPADKPRYTIMIAIKTFRRDGSDKPYYGGALAGPLFRSIADRIYTTNYDFIDPIKQQPILPSKALVAKAGPSDELNKLISEMKIVVTPAPSGVTSRLDTGRVVVVTPIDTDGSIMPDLRGMSASEAVRLLENRGMRVSIQGRGVVREQTPLPQTPVDRVTEVTITLEP